ncbi:MAG TPA: tautomerase family protein [Deltaproteobacteria bacterium]|nr:tautomerase family protein [Deltaproteobacteria bacterium]
MPHVIVKLYPGRSEQAKRQLTDAIVKDMVSIIQCDEKAISVAFEEVEPGDWAEKVYLPDIQNRKETLYKEPGYDPFA